jgi:hypothetical protein
MSTISANTFLAADGTTTTEPSIPALDQRMAKAWVFFNGTGTVAINSSYNVSSITDHGPGVYTVNFTSALIAGYSASSNAWNPNQYHAGQSSAHTRNTTGVAIRATTPSGTPSDCEFIDAQVFGN